MSGWMEWLEERTGIRSLLREMLDEPIPGGPRWAYVFGSGLLYLFVSQVITGVFLALYYVPSSDHAHTTVSYISKVVTSGLFLRSVHAYGATAIIILLFLHISQTLLYGSYKGRRELLWLAGCVLLALMLGMAFTGYLLPWDEKAYFASAVGTNIISEVPLVGPALEQLLRGSQQMGTLTLSRFFVLHVFILPGLLMAFIAAHLYFFRKSGPAGPIKEDPFRPTLPVERFYPRQLVMDMATSLLIILALALVAYFVPIHLGPEARPSDTYLPSILRPEMVLSPDLSVAGRDSKREMVTIRRHSSSRYTRHSFCSDSFFRPWPGASAMEASYCRCGVRGLCALLCRPRRLELSQRCKRCERLRSVGASKTSRDRLHASTFSTGVSQSCACACGSAGNCRPARSQRRGYICSSALRWLPWRSRRGHRGSAAAHRHRPEIFCRSRGLLAAPPHIQDDSGRYAACRSQ